MHGVRLTVNGVEYYGYPSPGSIIRVGPEGLRRLGLSWMKSRSLVEIAEASVEGRLPSVGEAVRNPQVVVGELSRIYGVGVWTASLAVAMVHPLFPVGPSSDLAVRRGLSRILGRSVDAGLVENFLSVLGEYAGLAMYLLSLYYESM